MPNKSLIASDHKPVSIYYCKAGLKTGLTVRVSQDNTRWACSAVGLSGIGGSIRHGNTTGPAKRSGAKCMAVFTSGVVCLENPTEIV